MRNRSALVLVPAFLAAAGCARGPDAPPAARPAPLVAAAKVFVRDVEVTVRAPVDLRPLLQAEVSAKTLGYLDAVLVDRGDPVRKGQLLALVRPSDLPDQLASARGTQAQAQAALALARANRDRANALAPSGRISKQELQQAESALAAAEAASSATGAQVGALAVRLGETRITSPLDGVVSQRRLDPGVLVGPGAGSGTILTVDQVDVLRLFLPVSESSVQKLKVGQLARVDLDAAPGHPYTGRVVRLAPGLDPATRTLDAEVHLPNPNRELRAGMYGRASIVTAVHPGAVTVPSAAVQFTNGKTFVFVLEGEQVRRRPVTVGVDGEEWLEIVAGLGPNDEIVTAGLEGLSDGAKVRAARAPDPAAPAAQPTEVQRQLIR